MEEEEIFDEYYSTEGSEVENNSSDFGHKK